MKDKEKNKGYLARFKPGTIVLWLHVAAVLVLWNLLE